MEVEEFPDRTYDHPAIYSTICRTNFGSKLLPNRPTFIPAN